MSDGKPMEEIPIEITPQRQDVVDNTKRRDTLLRGREIMRLGEPDNRFRDIVIVEEALNDMISFGMSDRTIEKGGALFGFHCGDQTIITRFLESPLAEGTPGTVNITADALADLHKRNDSTNQTNGTNDEILAWFHTHPADYPPTPLTTADRETMSRFFADSDKASPSDRSTVIMTTYAGNPNPNIAAWKWRADEQSANLVNGIGIACKDKNSAPRADYYSPVEETARIVKPITEDVAIDLTDLDEATNAIEIKDKGIEIKQNPVDDVITISLEDEQGETLEIKLDDLSPEPDTIKISLDEVTPEKARALVNFLNKNPEGRGNKLIRNILKAAKTILPPEIQRDVDLVLGQTKPINEQIEIIS